MKILVTGGSGFIGSNLCRKLLDNKNTIYCLDNFSTSSKDNIKDLIRHNDFYLIDEDISKINFNKLFKFNVDQIYHLAGPTAPGDFKKNPIETLKTNILGTINILEFANFCCIPVLFTSSIRVFETNHLDNNSSYTESKRICETLCYEYKKNNSNIKIARLTNIYGPGMAKNDSRVIPTFISNALKNEDIKILGSGNQIDSFCYIDDTISALIMYMNSQITDENFLYIGSKEKTSILELSKLIIKIIISKSQIKFENLKYIINDNRTKNVDLNKTKQLLNWEAKTNLESGLKKMIEIIK